MFLNDLDFFNKKLICIVSHIDNSIQYVNLNIISMLFAIHESDISKFYIINKNINIKKLTTIFRFKWKIIWWKRGRYNTCKYS